MRALILGTLLTGCVQVRRADDHRVDALGVTQLVVRADQADVDVLGATTDTFAIDATSWGFGATRPKADRRENANLLEVEPDPGVLRLTASTGFNLAGWEIGVQGPFQIDVNASVDDGEVNLFDLDGDHSVSATRVTATNVSGRVDLSAADGIDASLMLREGTTSTLTASGPVALMLPPNAPYDLRVVGDPDQPMVVDDLGFDELVLGPGTAEAWRAPGTIVILVDVTGGPFTLVPSF